MPDGAPRRDPLTRRLSPRPPFQLLPPRVARGKRGLQLGEGGRVAGDLVAGALVEIGVRHPLVARGDLGLQPLDRRRQGGQGTRLLAHHLQRGGLPQNRGLASEAGGNQRG